jgi:hypothetical protein
MYVFAGIADFICHGGQMDSIWMRGIGQISHMTRKRMVHTLQIHDIIGKQGKGY